MFDDSATVRTLDTYRRQALRIAEVTALGADEGYAARIPGFRGLLASGRTRKEALAELESALADWVDLALKRGLGLPAVRSADTELLSAR